MRVGAHVAELSADHVGVVYAPAVGADGAIATGVVDLHSPLVLAVATDQTYQRLGGWGGGGGQ